MTDHEAYHILNKHSQLFYIAEHNRQIPDRSENSMMEIFNALKHFQPGYHMDWSCGRCAFKMIEDADKIRKDYNLKFMTFPKQ